MDVPVFQPLGLGDGSMNFKPNVCVWVSSSEKPKGSEAWKVSVFVKQVKVFIIVASQIQEMLRHIDIALYLAPSTNNTLEVDLAEFILKSAQEPMDSMSGISREDFRRVSFSVHFRRHTLNVESIFKSPPK